MRDQFVSSSLNFAIVTITCHPCNAFAVYFTPIYTMFRLTSGDVVSLQKTLLKYSHLYLTFHLSLLYIMLWPNEYKSTIPLKVRLENIHINCPIFKAACRLVCRILFLKWRVIVTPLSVKLTFVVNLRYHPHKLIISDYKFFTLVFVWFKRDSKR